MKQLALFKVDVEHGGDHRRGKRKTARPIATRAAMHVTLRAEAATGRWSFHRKANALFIKNLVAALSARWGVRIYEFSNNGNHLHFLVRSRTREGHQNFFRVLSSKIALFVTGAKKGKALGKRFWDRLLWSRIVASGAFRSARDYVIQNRLEAAGEIPYQRRSAKPNLRPSSRRVEPPHKS